MGKQLYDREIHLKNVDNLYVQDIYQHYYKVDDVEVYLSKIYIYIIKYDST